MIIFTSLGKAIALLQADSDPTLLSFFSWLRRPSNILRLRARSLPHLNSAHSTIIARCEVGCDSRYPFLTMSVVQNMLLSHISIISIIATRVDCVAH